MRLQYFGMIAGNELRKGNLVKAENMIGRVTQIFLNSVEIQNSQEEKLEEVNFDLLLPIPVTLEILEKCDLLKHRRFYYANVFYSKTGKFTINQLRDNIEISFAVNSTPGIISDQNLAVHQLQNMFFALMHEELLIDI